MTRTGMHLRSKPTMSSLLPQATLRLEPTLIVQQRKQPDSLQVVQESFNKTRQSYSITPRTRHTIAGESKILVHSDVSHLFERMR